MARVPRDDGALLERAWVPVRIGGSHFLAKTWFGDTAYRVVLTDLQGAWEEEMDSRAIEERAQELNKRLRAPVSAFFSHLCEVAQPCLSGRRDGGMEEEVEEEEGGGGGADGGACITLARHGGGVNVRLKSKLSGLPFHWEFRCTPAPLELVCSQLVRPLLVMSRLLQRQVEQMGSLLVMKDLEIQDYRENGAVLSRERLQTDVFEEQSYRQSFFSQALPQACVLPDGFGFDPALRELYQAVAARSSGGGGGGGARKRRLSEQRGQEEEDEAAAPSTEPGGTIALGEGVSSDPAEGDRAGPPASQRPPQTQTGPPAAPGPVQPASRPKKKKNKVGLFR